MNSQIKPQVRTTSTRMQHNVELFLSSELGHSPKWSIKLLGRELSATSTTIKLHPYQKARGFFFGFISFSFASGKF
ncbi:hypothetical protein MTR67_052583 [Solanum verrucosum]|uniref:Uncharacterized protein n=1 Tax=Solanum verrucosum TaxID=315347 RepID=A0AAF0V5C5_SOLVR|nr:hypothetical protein MTR67_052583 [Solanum verrucosum]